MKSVCVLAILSVAISTSAMAKDLKQDRKANTNAPAVSAQKMNDADMDKVTAGFGAERVDISAPNGFVGTPGRGRSPVCFNCGPF